MIGVLIKSFLQLIISSSFLVTLVFLLVDGLGCIVEAKFPTSVLEPTSILALGSTVIFLLSLFTQTAVYERLPVVLQAKYHIWSAYILYTLGLPVVTFVSSALTFVPFHGTKFNAVVYESGRWVIRKKLTDTDLKGATDGVITELSRQYPRLANQLGEYRAVLCENVGLSADELTEKVAILLQQLIKAEAKRQRILMRNTPGELTGWFPDALSGLANYAWAHPVATGATLVTVFVVAAHFGATQAVTQGLLAYNRDQVNRLLNERDSYTEVLEAVVLTAGPNAEYAAKILAYYAAR